jgi:hypothetical protein
VLFYIKFRIFYVSCISNFSPYYICITEDVCLLWYLLYLQRDVTCQDLTWSLCANFFSFRTWECVHHGVYGIRLRSYCAKRCFFRHFYSFNNFSFCEITLFVEHSQHPVNEIKSEVRSYHLDLPSCLIYISQALHEQFLHTYDCYMKSVLFSYCNYFWQ